MAMERIKETLLFSVALAMAVLTLGIALPNHDITFVTFPVKDIGQQVSSRNYSERVGFKIEIPKEWSLTFENEDKKVVLSAEKQTVL